MKRLLSMILVLCLVFGLVACTKPADKNPTEPAATDSTTQTVPTVVTEVSATAAAPEYATDPTAGVTDVIVSEITEPTERTEPTVVPTTVPTVKPTTEPTEETKLLCSYPTRKPVTVVVPTTKPTVAPTTEPTTKPTADTKPASEPTEETKLLCSYPTKKPITVMMPATKPTAAPTTEPTTEPTAAPTTEPTTKPTAEPTLGCSTKPTADAKPTSEPTTVPTDATALAAGEDDSDAPYRDVAIVQAGKTTTTRIFGQEINANNLTNVTQVTEAYPYKVRNSVLNNLGERDDCVVERYQGDTKLWDLTLQNVYANGHTFLSNGIMLFAKQSGAQTLIKISAGGEQLWSLKLKHSTLNSILGVVENADGSYAVFTSGWSGDEQCLGLTQVSADGQKLSYVLNKIGENRFCCAARVGDGYWLHIGRDEFTVIRMDRQGYIIDSLSFDEESANYDIRSMIEYNGKVYMSVNSSPKIAEKYPESYNGQDLYDIHVLCEDIDTEAVKEWEASGAVHGHEPELENKSYDITDRIQNHYTAMLLVCDAETGKALEYHRVQGSLGGKLFLNEDGTLTWCVENTLEAYRFPLSCTRTWEVKRQVYHCILNTAGKLSAVQKTEHISGWYYKRFA